MSVVVTVGVVAVLVSRHPFVWQDMDTAGLHAIGVLLGLVVSEQCLRWRDARRRAVVPAATPAVPER